MTNMLILNAVLATTIVTAVLALLGWGIVTDRARIAAIGRHALGRARVHAGGQAVQPDYRRYVRAQRVVDPQRSVASTATAAKSSAR